MDWMMPFDMLKYENIYGKFDILVLISIRNLLLKLSGNGYIIYWAFQWKSLENYNGFVWKVIFSEIT